MTERPVTPNRSGPMPFAMLLDEAMRRTRRSFRAIYPAVAIPLALLATLTNVIQILWLQHRATESGAGASFLGNPFLSLPAFVMPIVQGLLLGIGLIALQQAAVDATAGRPIDLQKAWRFAVRPAVLGTLFLELVACAIAFLACIFPVFYVVPLLSLVPAVMVEERIFGLAALSRSAELTRYNPRKLLLESPIVKAFALLLVVTVISYVVAFLVTLPFQIPMLISIFRHAAAGKDPSLVLATMPKWLWFQIPAQILQTLATVAIYLYSAFGYALLFFDTRGRKEGSDLAAEIHSVFGPRPEIPPAGELAP